MSYIFGSGQIRPNRLTAKKDKDYHRDYARWCLSAMSNFLYRKYINKCLVNWSFFKGSDGQWILDEDIEAFFLDESGDVRNRLRWTKNVIKPMVQQYVGNAIRLAYDAKATCISDFVINKRESDLKRLKSFQQIGEKFPFLKDIIKEFEPVEESEAETEEMFYNTFVENYDKDINNLLEFISHDVNIEELKVQITRNLALCGLGIYKGYEESDLYMGAATNPLFYLWDMSAVKPDLSDSEWMGEWYYMDAPSLFEKYQDITPEERQHIEHFNNNSNRSNGVQNCRQGAASNVIQGSRIRTHVERTAQNTGCCANVGSSGRAECAQERFAVNGDFHLVGSVSREHVHQVRLSLVLENVRNVHAKVVAFVDVQLNGVRSWCFVAQARTNSVSADGNRGDVVDNNFIAHVLDVAFPRSIGNFTECGVSVELNVQFARPDRGDERTGVRRVCVKGCGYGITGGWGYCRHLILQIKIGL